MILLCSVAGLLLGTFLHQAADYLPRWSSSTSSNPQSRPRWIPAVCLLLATRLRRTQGEDDARAVLLDAAVELFTGALLIYLWASFGFTWNLFLVTVLCSFFILTAIIDAKYRLILNVLLFPAALVTLLFSFISPQLNGTLSLIGGAFGLCIFALAALVRPGELGGGDVKLATLIGLIFGFPNAIWVLMVGILSGGLAAVLLLLTRRGGRSTRMPYAPFLCLGAILALFYNPFASLWH